MRTRRCTLSFAKQETIRLNQAGFSGVLPVDPTELKRVVESFGLFGGSGESNKFFPNVSASDLIPKPEDFVKVPFRLISCTVVGAGTWKATDFSDAVLLKASMTKLPTKPLFFDHDQDIMNWVGLIDSVSWSESFTAPDGTKVPAGIDGILAIDAKTNPKLARGVLMGAIFSDSVTVVFDWIPSHKGMSDSAFFEKIGTVVDGHMVCRKVTAIYDYHETSLCWLGADPFAKMYDDKGNLKNVDTSAVFASETETVRNSYTENSSFSATFGYDKKVALSLTKSLFNSSNNKTETKMNPKLQAMLCLMLGLAAGTEITEANFTEGMAIVPKDQVEANKANAALAATVKEKAKTALGKDPEDVSAFLTTHTFVEATKLTGMEKDVATVASLATETGVTADKLVETVKLLKVESTAGKAAIELKRTETTRLYKLQADNKPDQSVLDLITAATSEQLDGLAKSYTKGVTASFVGTCTKCHATGKDITFRSSIASGDDAGNTEVADAVTEQSVSFDQIYREESKGKMSIGK